MQIRLKLAPKIDTSYGPKPDIKNARDGMQKRKF